MKIIGVGSREFKDKEFMQNNFSNKNKKQSYWKEFYKNQDILKHSSFSKFCLNYIHHNSKIIEFGCGNGRDTYFLGKIYGDIKGVDYACKPIDINNIKFIQSDLITYLENNKNTFDTIYSRFFLHSITNNEINKLLNWSKGLMCLEFRAKNDIPILYPDHYRNIIDENNLLIKILSKGFDLIYYSKSYGVAKYKKEDPLIVRIIAKKEQN